MKQTLATLPGPKNTEEGEIWTWERESKTTRVNRNVLHTSRQCYSTMQQHEATLEKCNEDGGWLKHVDLCLVSTHGKKVRNSMDTFLCCVSYKNDRSLQHNQNQTKITWNTPDHLLLDNAPDLGPLISCGKIKKFENCWYKSVRILEVLKLSFQQFLHLWSSQRDMSGPKLGALSNNRWSRGNLPTVLRWIFLSCKL